MSIIELFLIAFGLSMDAFAVAVCKGLALKSVSLRHSVKAGLWFGGFQALMPLIGYFCGYWFRDYISAFDHWIAFALLSILGIKMIKEALSHEEEETDSAMDFKNMLILAVATSIDALAAGISFAFLDVNIWWAIGFIGCITFILSALGIKIGSIFGAKFKSKAEILGGLILIFMGVKILLEHLGVFSA